MRFPNVINIPTWRLGAFKFQKVSYHTSLGIGSDLEQGEIDSLGFISVMKASSFLKCAEKIRVPDPDTLKFFNDALDVHLPIGVFRLNWNVKNRKIVGQDGRHRALAILKKYGDIHIPVAVKSHVLRPHNLPSKILELFSEAVYNFEGKLVRKVSRCCLHKDYGWIEGVA